MTHVLLVSKEKIGLEPMAIELLKDNKNVIHQLDSGQQALALVGQEKIDVVVVAEELSDSDGLSFVKDLTKKYPLINCAMISSLPHDEFHEETEGLGVFMQLPLNPGAKETEQMMGLLESINVLMTM